MKFDAEDIESAGGSIVEKGRVQIKRPPRYLCFRCAHSHVYKVEGSNQEHVFCKLFESTTEVPDCITECSRFQAAGTLSIWELSKLAKFIDIDPKKVGFNKG